MNIHSYEPQEIRLANEIAETLQDRDALPLYLSYARKYQEGFLRRILLKVMSIEASKIRRNRASLFVYLVTQSQHETKHTRD